MKRFTALLTLIGSAALATGPASAGETCYDFAQQPVGLKYLIGETIQAEHLKVRITDYKVAGLKADKEPGAQFVEVRSSSLAGGAGPELYSYLATMRIEPHTPVTQLRLRVGESQGGYYNGHANIEFNGTVREVTGSLALLDGQDWNDGAGGHIRITANLSLRGGNRWDGTLKVRAVSGEIRSFGIGGAALAVDDVCFTPNAP